MEAYSDALQKKERKALQEKFYRGIIDGTIPGSPESIRRMQRNLGFPENTEIQTQMVLFDFRQWERIDAVMDRIDFEFCIKNLAAELFSDICITYVSTIPVYEKYYLSIFRVNPGDHEEQVRRACSRLNLALKKLVGVGVNCCALPPCPIHEMNRHLIMLLEMSRRLSCLEGAFASSIPHVPDPVPCEAEINQCYQSLLRADEAALRKYTGLLFEKAVTDNTCSYYQMENLMHRYQQSVVACLRLRNISDAVLSRNENYFVTVHEALFGPAKLRSWMDYVNSTALSALQDLGNEAGVIESVKSYITTHISEDIQRKNIAEFVYLNEDYLSRLFSRKEGIPLSHFIAAAKVERAKELLALSDLSVTSVAEKVGIGNFSYFSRMFKNQTGLSPSAYRKQVSASP